VNLKEVLAKYQELPEFADTPLTDVNQRSIGEDAPLHVASRWGALEDVEVLVAAGANVNQAGDIGNTPLHEAAGWDISPS
jgi:ankyrin repeat protein